MTKTEAEPSVGNVRETLSSVSETCLSVKPADCAVSDLLSLPSGSRGQEVNPDDGVLKIAVQT